MSDIEADLEEGIWESDAFQGAPIAPPDPTIASEWLAKLEAMRARKQEYLDAHAHIVDKLNNRLRERTAGIDQEIGWLEESLQMYHRTVLASDPKRLTIDLPTGSLVSRKSPDKWEVENPDEFIQWALSEGHEEFIDFPAPPPPKVLKNEVKKGLKDLTVSDGKVMLGDGTVVPGLSVTRGDRKYEAKTEVD